MSDAGLDQLVRRARQGSREAAAELVRRHWRRAWSRGFAVTGRSSLADDIAQETMAAALERLDELERPEAFAGWVTTIATRRALDVLRAERRLTDLGEAPEPALEWSGALGEAAEVREAIGRLAPERRTVIVLRYWLELTPSEIAGELGLPVGTVNSRTARALEDLRTLLGESSRA